MNQIDKLKQKILDIEDQAGTTDPTDHEALYKLLAPAFFAAKDIIELLEKTSPMQPETCNDEELKIEINRLTTHVDLLEKEAALIPDILNGYKEQLQTYQNTISNIDKELSKLQ